MTDMILYGGPYTCSKVSAIWLEEAGAAFETRLIRHPKGEHKSPEFKRFNPKGKVPALLIDGRPLTENVAIAVHLNGLFPAAKLLPDAPDALAAARQIADLCFCAATLHPFVTRICVPMLFVDRPGWKSVQQFAKAGVREYLQIVEDRLADGPWWYGDSWSAMDPYLYWVFWRLGVGSDFDRSPYPRLRDHAARIEARPAVQRAIARETADLATFAAEGLVIPPPFAGGT